MTDKEREERARITERRADELMGHGQKLFNAIVAELNTLSYDHVRKTPESFRRYEDLSELWLALGLMREIILDPR